MSISTRWIEYGQSKRRSASGKVSSATMHLHTHWLIATSVIVSFISPINASRVAPKGTEGGDPSLLWGTYRPNLYFGLRPRLPYSLMSGMMWFGTQDYNQFQSKSSLARLEKYCSRFCASMLFEYTSSILELHSISLCTIVLTYRDSTRLQRVRRSRFVCMDRTWPPSRWCRDYQRRQQ